MVQVDMYSDENATDYTVSKMEVAWKDIKPVPGDTVIVFRSNEAVATACGFNLERYFRMENSEVIGFGRIIQRIGTDYIVAWFAIGTPLKTEKREMD